MIDARDAQVGQAHTGRAQQQQRLAAPEPIGEPAPPVLRRQAGGLEGRQHQADLRGVGAKRARVDRQQRRPQPSRHVHQEQHARQAHKGAPVAQAEPM
jgi:hypothetical protein